MELHIYQLLVIAISAVMIYQGVARYAKHESGQTFFKILVRVSVWGGMIAISLFPNITNVIADLIGLKGNINAVILTGFLLVFLMIFKLLSAIERLEQNITEVTRERTLESLHRERND